MRIGELIAYCRCFLCFQKGGKIRNNIEVRIAMIKANIKHYQVAEKLGIAEHNFSRKLRYELSKKEKDRVLQAIKELKGGNY